MYNTWKCAPLTLLLCLTLGLFDTSRRFTDAFHVPTNSVSVKPSSRFRTTISSFRLDATTSNKGGGMGMGMGKTSDNNKKGNKKKGVNGSSSSSSSSSAQSTFNVNASLLRLEKLYGDLTLANAKAMQKDTYEEDEDDDDSDSDNDNNNIHGDTVATEYVIATRALPTIPDWVPIAQLLLVRSRDSAAHASEGASDPAVQASISLYCRELSHVATLGSRVFTKVPRNLLEYSVESADSFHKHVYESVNSNNNNNNMDSNNNDSNNANSKMTKALAREILGLPADGEDDAAEIKKRYRQKSFALHPDRLVMSDQENDKDQKAAEFTRVRMAYDVLTSGMRRRHEKDSWYASLGGRARTDFVGPVRLMPIAEAQNALTTSGLQSAIIGLDPDMVQAFVARSQTMVVA